MIDTNNSPRRKDDVRPARALNWADTAPTGAQLADVMIDTETLGTTPGSAILSIGAVMFGPAGLGEEFYAPISLASCTAAGLTIDPGTVAWWMKQSDAARAAAFRDDAEPLPVVLQRFTSWLDQVGAERPWSHGANFDPPLLEAAYRACGMMPPWKYWNVRDTRTLYDLADVQVDRARGTHHNALDDARAQAEAAVVALQRLQNARTGPSVASPAGIELDKLEALARAATPGPWVWWTSNSYMRLSARGDGDVMYGHRLHDGVCTVAVNDADATFIETLNPSTVLALIAQARAQQASAAPFAHVSRGTEEEQLQSIDYAASQPPAPVVADDVMAAALAVVQGELDGRRNEVHPCDRDDDDVVVRQCSSEIQTLHAALKAAPSDATGKADGLPFAIEALKMCATWIENITPEQLELWRGTKVAEIHRDLRTLAKTGEADAANAGGLLPKISADEMAAFNRFCECAEDFDSGGHDVPKDMMKRLAAIGLVRACGFGRHETTLFGDAIRNGDVATSAAAEHIRDQITADANCILRLLDTVDKLVGGTSGATESIQEHAQHIVQYATKIATSAADAKDAERLSAAIDALRPFARLCPDGVPALATTESLVKHVHLKDVLRAQQVVKAIDAAIAATQQAAPGNKTQSAPAEKAGGLDERALFQREVLRLGIVDDEGTWEGVNSSEGWYYFDDEVNACWKAWKARAALDKAAAADAGGQNG